MHNRDEQMAVFNYAGSVPGKRSQMAGSHDMFDVAEYDRLQHPDIANKPLLTQNNLYMPDAITYEDLNALEVPMHNIGGVAKRGHVLDTVRDAPYDDMSDLHSSMRTQPGRIRTL